MKFKNITMCVCGLLGFFYSCSNDSHVDSYTIKIKSNIENADSVKLLVYEPDYKNLRILNSGKLKNGKLILTGQIKEQSIAFLDYGKKESITFILEKCETEITIGKDNIVVWGGKSNHNYLAKCDNVYALQSEIKNIELTYKRRASDSTFNKKEESRLLKKHKSLTDSLQNTIVNTINNNDEIGKLFKEKFINKLDGIHLRKIK